MLKRVQHDVRANLVLLCLFGRVYFLVTTKTQRL